LMLLQYDLKSASNKRFRIRKSIEIDITTLFKGVPKATPQSPKMCSEV